MSDGKGAESDNENVKEYVHARKTDLMRAVYGALKRGSAR